MYNISTILCAVFCVHPYEWTVFCPRQIYKSGINGLNGDTSVSSLRNVYTHFHRSQSNISTNSDRNNLYHCFPIQNRLLSVFFDMCHFHWYRMISCCHLVLYFPNNKWWRVFPVPIKHLLAFLKDIFCPYLMMVLLYFGEG